MAARVTSNICLFFLLLFAVDKVGSRYTVITLVMTNIASVIIDSRCPLPGYTSLVLFTGNDDLLLAMRTRG